MRVRALTVTMLAMAAVLMASTGAGATHGVNIAGEVGTVVDPDASDFDSLRYVGDPAPPGFSHGYQWSNPFLRTEPESGAVTFTGEIDLTNRVGGSVAFIGLSDWANLASGNTDYQDGAFIYVFARSGGGVRIGVTDGNDGGEIVQSFKELTAAMVAADPTLDVMFTIDADADPVDCAVLPPAIDDTATSEGCLTLVVSSSALSPTTIEDSYGAITVSGIRLAGDIEFAGGAVPGWDAFPGGGSTTGISYDLTVSPVIFADPTTKDDCKKGGYQLFGFDNQGRCIQFVNTGIDSRHA